MVTSRRRDWLTLAAFVGTVVVMGLNSVAIRFSNRELDPFWGAALRFLLATLVLAALVVLLRVPMPRGAALRAVVLWGVLGFAAGYGLIYYGLVHIGAALGQIVMAVVPLATLLLAASVGLERLRWRGVVGAVVALAGIAVAFSGEARVGVPFLSLLAVLGSAVAIAASSVVLKRAPRAHPLAANLLGMGVGGLLLLAVSGLLSEPWHLPRTWEASVAVVYLVVTSIVGFMLFLFVLSRWSASATSYVLVLMPFVTVAGAAALAGEPVTARLVLGGAVVIGGVWLGALWRGKGEAAAAAPPAAAPGPR